MPKSKTFEYPSTRYSGSKLRFLEWIWENIKNLKFDSVLDVFGGTGSVSLMFKRMQKKVYYNDILKFNQIIAKAIVENSSVIVTENEINDILELNVNGAPPLIQEQFSGIFFLDHENRWIDETVHKIFGIKDEYKRSILLASLFQACLSKRPFNLFHRANLYIRTADVSRTFGNKVTWETPFPVLLRRFVNEYNNAIFSNGRANRVIGGYDALSTPNGVDLVYLDPPYFSRQSSQGTNYLAYYHFLERLANYDKWNNHIDDVCGKSKRLSDTLEISRFVKKSEITNSLEKVIQRFHQNIIVLSYQSDGIPATEDIIAMFKNTGKRVRVYEKPHRYVLSKKTKKEILFVAQ